LSGIARVVSLFASDSSRIVRVVGLTFDMRRTLAFATVSTLLAASAPAQPAPAVSPDPHGALHASGADVSISLLTVSAGSEVWELFGHSALWIHDNRSGRDTVFNWGAFNRDAPNFIPHFLEGLLLYQMGGDSLQEILLGARGSNRTVTSQELNLSAPEKDSILSAIRHNALPENVIYRYDYFIENCATRPRDLLDRALGGQLRAGADSLSGSTYRSNTLRLMQGDRPIVLGVDIVLGEPSDRPITKWQEMFLPRKLHDWVATREVRDSAGVLHSLVKSERVLVQGNRPPEPQRPPGFAWLWIAGAIMAGAFAWLGVAARTPGAARVSAATVFSIWSVASGVLGVILTLLWTATDHRFARANENLLLFNPLWLVLAVTLPMTVLRERAVWVTNRLLLVVFALGGLALVAHLIGLSRQTNLPIIALGLLPAAGLIFATRQARKHDTSTLTATASAR
jgi:Domain of unknown function (DUF4105)